MMKYAELYQLMGIIAIIIGASIMNWGFGIFIAGIILTTVGVLGERSMLHGPGRTTSTEG